MLILHSMLYLRALPSSQRRLSRVSMRVQVFTVVKPEPVVCRNVIGAMNFDG